MKAKEIQELIDFIAKSGLAEVNVETDSFKIKVKRDSVVASESPAPAMKSTPAKSPDLVIQQSQVNPEVSPQNHSESQAKEESPASSNLVEVKSPMIGTFYRSPDPDSASFVNVGDTIAKGQVVCIIEAMKLFNEIESEVSGTVVKILVDNASPVEYDQALFLVEPN